MAQRRMFSLKIVDSDAFMDMPQSSQLLYIHLAVRADDDGFISNPKKIMRMVGSQDDDYKVLISKRFIIPFESGVCVIKHWKIHNYIQSDRYTPTAYLDEKSTLFEKENGAYTECIQSVPKMETQVRLGKVRLGKVKQTETVSPKREVKKVKLPYVSVTPFKELTDTMDLFKAVNPSHYLLFKHVAQLKALDQMCHRHGVDRMREIIAILPKTNVTKYAPTITTPTQLEANLGKLWAFMEKSKSSGKGKVIIT